MIDKTRYPNCRILFLVWVGCVLIGSPVAGQPPVPVVVQEARVDRFVDRVEALGTLRANESVALTVTVTETVTAIHFEDGGRIKAGAILVEMTNTEEHALLEEERFRASEAKKQYERVRPLVEQGAASISLLDQTLRDYETANARLRAIRSRLQDRLVVAPFSGVVGLRNLSVGALIAPGDVVTTLDDDSVMKLDFTVPAIHLATLRRGLPIEAVSPAFPSQVFEGTVSSMDSRIDPVTRSIRVRALIPNPENLLKPGLLMQVALIANAREVVVIPEEALIPSGQQTRVLVVDRSADPPSVRRRPVATGSRRPGEVEIREGLDVGEFVVTHGGQRAGDGHAVTIVAVDSGDEPLARLLSREPEGSGR